MDNKKKRNKKRFFAKKDYKRSNKLYAINLTKSRKIILASCDRTQQNYIKKQLQAVCNEHISKWLELQKLTSKVEENEIVNDEKQEKEEEKALTIDDIQTPCIISSLKENEISEEASNANSISQALESEELKASKIQKPENNIQVNVPKKEEEKVNEKVNEMKDVKEFKEMNENSAENEDKKSSEINSIFNLPPPIKKRKLNDEPGAIVKKSEQEPGAQSVNISDEICNELEDFSSTKHCQWIQSPPGLVVIDILPTTSITAVELLNFMFEKEYPKRPKFPPNIYRFYPLNRSCFADEQQIISLSKKMIDEFWTSDILPTKDTFAILSKKRGNSKIRTHYLISEIANHPKLQGFKVNLNLKMDGNGVYAGPSVVIMIQIFGRAAGMSIIKDNMFLRYKKYTLSQFAIE